jgi:hypothetical protein
VSGTRWILRPGDYRQLRSHGSLRGIFNIIHVYFEDTETGEMTTASAADQASQAKLGTFARLIRAGHPLAKAEGQDIADRAIDILGGEPVTKRFVTLSADRRLLRGDGDTHPAGEIRDLDTMQLGDAEGAGEFYVEVLSRNADENTIELGLSDGREGRLEMELELLNLQRGE